MITDIIRRPVAQDDELAFNCMQLVVRANREGASAHICPTEPKLRINPHAIRRFSASTSRRRSSAANKLVDGSSAV